MICIVGTREFPDNSKIYTFYETNTDSFFNGNGNNLREILDKHGIQNASLSDSSIIIDNQIHCEIKGIHTGSPFNLICKINENKFKIVGYDERIICIDRELLEYYVKEQKIANCDIIDGKLRCIGNYTVTKEQEFEKSIAEKYIIYTAKSTILGLNMSFNYSIEGKRVKLIKYTGTTINVIVPKFVTAIMEKAFYHSKIETITLDEGLKYIGNEAFAKCNLSEVVMPKSVEFMGMDLFRDNSRLLKDNKKYREDRVKILNKEAIVLDLREKYL